MSDGDVPTREELNARRKAFYERFERGDLSLQEAAKLMRAVTGMTQAGFAGHRGVSVQTIQDLEGGRDWPALDELDRIVSIFGLEAQRGSGEVPTLAYRPRAVVDRSADPRPVTTTVRLSVASRAEVSARFLDAVKDKAQGPSITFDSPALLFQTLTQLRWSLLESITGAGPLSLRAITRRVGRDVRAVHRDVQALLSVGLLEHTGSGQVVFPYDAVHVDFVLGAD